MMRSNIGTTLVVVLAIAAACSGQAYQIYSGRALDANNMVGGDGTNPTRSGGPAYDPNAIVNGQVTGGYSFHGNIGYTPGNQLHLNLPSAPMDNFVRDSAGMPQLRYGNTYGPQMYYSPGGTVMTAGNIATGMNLPGTSTPSSLSSPKAQQLYQQAIQPYVSAMPSLDEQMRVGSTSAALTGADKDGLKATALDRGGEGDSVVASGLFGILRPKDQAELAAELDQPGKTATSDAKVDALIKTGNQLDTRGPLVKDPKDAKAATDGKGAAKAGQDASDKNNTPDLAARGGAAALDKAGSLPKPGQDVFVDMLVKMDALKGGKLAAKDKTSIEIALEPEKETPPSLDRYRPGKDASGAKPGAEGAGKGAKDAKPAVETAENQLRLHHLAGMGQDEFNRHMLAAEDALSQGKYYQAAGEYEVATLINHVNPLAHLGQAVALFGAFEPLSSARSLREAMHSFPPLMDADVDVAGLLGKDVVNVRMNMLRDRLDAAKEPDAGVIFLVCFIYANNDRPDLALEQAHRLQKLSKDEVHQAYAQALIKRFENNLPQNTPPKPPPQLSNGITGAP